MFAAHADDKLVGNPQAVSVYGEIPDLGNVRNVSVGGDIIRALPMRVGNLDVLSPFTNSLSGLGASATQINPSYLPKGTPASRQSEFFQINIPNQAPIILQIGQAVAYVGGVRKPLLAAPLYSKGKIWLPVFSLAPLLGASARVSPDGTLNLNPTVQGVNVLNVNGTLTVTVSTSAPVPSGKVLMGTLSDPPKIYFDLPGFSMGFDANSSTNERVVSRGNGAVTQVRAGLFQSFPDTTRIVVDLSAPMQATSQAMRDNRLLAFSLTAQGASNYNVAPIVNDVPTGNGSLKGMTIVVDAGHGGHDGGASGKNSQEKNHTLDISKRLAAYLRNMGANAILSRGDDTFISLQGRVAFANSRKADIFISVHLNSASSSSANGTETYYYTTQSKALAQEVQRTLDAASGLTDRGVKTARYYVIRNTTMPAILTESCFISNPREEALVMQPSYRDRLAQAMAQGIANYVKKYR